MAGDILLGVVIGASGLKGAVKVKTFTGEPAAIGRYGDLHSKAGRRFAIASAAASKGDEVVVQFADVHDRSAAEALKGTELFVSRGSLPAVDDGEYYHADLLGLRCEDSDGRFIGTLKAIHNFGAGDVIEVEAPDGSDLMLSFNRDTVPLVDVKAGRIVVAVPTDDVAEQHHGVE